MPATLTCGCKTKMVLLSGRLINGAKDEGKVWACPNCDSPDNPVSEESKNIIQLSEENHDDDQHSQ
jgi:hypothetical protein